MELTLSKQQIEFLVFKLNNLEMDTEEELSDLERELDIYKASSYNPSIEDRIDSIIWEIEQTKEEITKLSELKTLFENLL